MMKTLFKIFLLVFCLSVVTGQSYTGSAAFLKRGMSARAIGMGSAYTAVANDASATFWNPAGLLNSRGTNFQIGNIGMLTYGDVNSPQFALSHKFRKPLPLLNSIYYALGISADFYIVKDIDQYDNASNYIDSFDYGEYAVFLSGAFKVRFVKLGFTYKYIKQSFGINDPFIQNNKVGLARKPHDMGLLFNPVKFLTVGMVVRDSIKLGLYDTYPKSRQLGLKFDLNKIKESFPNIIVSMDVIVIQNSLNKLNVGGEYEINNIGDFSFALRGGLSNMIIGLENENINEIIQLNKKLSFGLGVQYKKNTIDVALVQDMGQNSYSSFWVFTYSYKN